MGNTNMKEGIMTTEWAMRRADDLGDTLIAPDKATLKHYYKRFNLSSSGITGREMVVIAPMVSGN
jgi:hypothetical protein